MQHHFFFKLGISSLEGIKPHGYGSIPINTIFSGMNIHLPAILMFTHIICTTQGLWRWRFGGQVFSPMAPTRIANWDTRTPSPALWRVSRTYGRPIRRAPRSWTSFGWQMLAAHEDRSIYLIIYIIDIYNFIYIYVHDDYSYLYHSFCESVYGCI